ncbi:TetR/AcrR family transcriptional regulator [Mycolicibacterium goodii]|uniref:TetR/AcrR family transcriptional regulator n=1 Tax=Mycolicibacterium goodii TaxID=134601 RepID=UPI001BDBDEF5|nr:TetR family transcriptional regulator [Mycolicibacterium goodii]MBU8820844.1 TetR family transcriptional regulator [Mycolicibacterium goodii]MBU8834505.1 TetR family transcriptional regulator [Mycolicibacterium goodii]
MAYVKAAVREEQIISAAMRVLGRVGVPGTTLRAVAAEAGIPLGTMQHVFPTKDQLLRAVITTVVEDISAAFRAEVELDKGLEHALRHGITSFWERLVMSDIGLQVMQYELTTYSIRAEGSGGLAQVQYERYSSLVTDFCRRAAVMAGERCDIGWDSLGRIVLAAIDGLILQYVADPDRDRAMGDLGHVLDMIVLLAAPRSASAGSAR